MRSQAFNPGQCFSPCRHPALALALWAACLAWSGQDAAAAPAARGQDRPALQAPDGGYKRSLAWYDVPALDLVDVDGGRVSLARLLDGDTPVMLNFIFTSCGAICPVMSATFAKVQAGLGASRRDPLLVSISIDPEQDTPLALRNYARHYGAGPRWKMLTGSLGNSVAVQRAFNAYRGDKMNHAPVTFMRAGPRRPWLRIEGFANADDLIREYRRLAAK